MNKTFKSALSITLCIAIFITGNIFAFASSETNDGIINGSLKIVQYNVGGLPIPTSISGREYSVSESQAENAKCLNGENADIIAVQEDFDYHYILEADIDLPYKTISSGGTVVGDGMNIWSKYQMFNVNRVKWNTLYGVIDGGNDELTPKGILYCTVEIEDGVYVDLYVIHADAYGDENSLKAKIDNFSQLSELVEKNSGTRAVIITGDWNTHFYYYTESDLEKNVGDALRSNFMDKGFKDTWVESENNGIYSFTFNEMYERYHTDYWGHWDCLDKTFYRDGDGVSFKTYSHKYTYYGGDGTQQLYSDHAASIAEMSYSVDKSKVPQEDITKETESFSLIKYIKSIIINFINDFVLIFKELPGLIGG